MKDIGIRQLKSHASDLVRQVSEHHETYAITRHGRTVGVLAPPDFVAPDQGEAADREAAWDRLVVLADKMNRGTGKRASAVRELNKSRR
jgi:prevent-host-death family protein